MSDLNQNFPAGPSADTGKPVTYGGGPSAERDDLLSQISAGDDASAQPKRKSRHSIVMEFVVLFMKITFTLDDAKRKNQKLFDTLELFWGALLALVYLCGVITLGLLLYSYLHFPELVKRSLIHQGIIVKDYQIKNYSLSKVELHNLEDKNGTYSIRKMEIHSTFADFLKGRVKSVILDGVRVKINQTKTGLEIGSLPQTLLDINQAPITQKIKVDSLSMSNAILDINGTDYKLPVSFSLTGVYERDSKISIPLFIKEQNVNIIGSLSIAGNQKEMTFVLKITSGTLTLPKRSPDNINGELTVVTRKMVPEKVTGGFNLSYGRNTKKINVNVTKERDNSYKGNVDLAIANLDSIDVKKEIKSNFSVSFDGLQVNSLYDFSTSKPVKIIIQSFQNKDLNLKNVSAVLNGSFACKNQVCSYRIRQFSPVFIKESSVLFNSDVIKSTDEYSFSFSPNNKDTFVWKNGKILYNTRIERANFSGYKNARLTPVSLTAGNVNIEGEYDVANVSQKLFLNIQKFIVITPEFSITGGNMKNDNVFDENGQVSFSAERITLADNSIFKAPFKLQMTKNGLDSKGVLSLDNNMVQLSFSGLSRLLSGEFKGNVFIHPVDLSKLSQPLDQIFGLFPEGIEKPTGQMGGLGAIYWKNSKQITGPLYVAFKDVGFKIKDTTVGGLNTVLSFQTVVPLMTPAGQKVFIERVDGPVAVQNVLADVKLEPQFVKLAGATAWMGGIPLQADTALIATRSNSFTLFFRNNAVDWAGANPYLKLEGALLAGRGSVLLPVEFQSDGVSIKNAELKITNGDMNLEKAKSPWFVKNMEGAKGLFVRSADMFLSSGEKNIVDMMLTLDGRLQPSQQLKNIKETWHLPLGDVVSPMAITPVPAEIVKKQRIILK